MHEADTVDPPETALVRLGWDERFATEFEPHRENGYSPARVTAEHRGTYIVVGEGGELGAEPSGKLRHEALGRGDLPAVGDWVALQTRADEGRATIHAVLPRRTKFSRKAAWAATEEQVVAANVDVVFIVSALTAELSLRRLERYLTLAWESGASPVVVLNKSDLCPDLDGAIAEVETVTFGVPVVITSAVTGEGLEELRSYVGDGRTVALLGSSGVGKSTLLNALSGRDVQRTAELRADGRGRHTTTHRELVALPSGGLLLDTPGMRELQLWSAADGFESTFDDIESLAATCRFADCAHESEPGCAVLEAERSGTLPSERLASYRKLQRELRALALRQDKRAAADERRRWRSLQRARRADQKPGR